MRNNIKIILVNLSLIFLTSYLYPYSNGIEIRTPKPGVLVIVDGEERGYTENKFNMNILIVQDILPGEHSIKYIYKDYEPFYTKIIVPKDKTIVHEVQFTTGNIKVETLESSIGIIRKKTGNIIIKSIPSKAYISLNENEQGVSDIILKNVPVGEHFIEVFFDKNISDQYQYIPKNLKSLFLSI